MTALFPPFPLPPFPEIGLPIFLEPLRLVPYFQGRLAETLKRWLDGRHTQIFGPLEQVVAATVIIGLDFWSGSNPPQPPDPAASPPPGNATGPAPASTWTPPAPQLSPTTDVSGWLGRLQALVDQRLPAPMTLGLIAMVLNLAVMLVPPETRTRLRESWSLFWPPWQDRTLLSRPTPATAEPLRREGPPTESERAREMKAEGRSAEPRRDTTEEEKARMKDRQRAKMAAQVGTEKHLIEERAGVKKERRNDSRAAGSAGPEKSTKEEPALSDEEKAKVRAKQKARLEAAEKAKAAGEGLTTEEKEKIRAKQKARLAVEGEKGEGEEGKGKDNAGTDKNAISEDEKARMKAKIKARELEKATSTESADASAKDSGRRSPSEEEKARMKRREETARLEGNSQDTKAAGSAPTASRRVSAEDGGLDRATSSAATAVQQATAPVVATPPPGLSRSELARWYKRQQEGAGLPMGATGAGSAGNASGVVPAAPATISTSSSSATSLVDPPHKSALKKPSTSGASPGDTAESPTAGKASNAEDGTSRASSGEDDALMAGDYRPLKSALKKSKKKPRQKKNIHHNYFMTMRGYQPHLLPFPHGLHPKPYHPRHTLWWDNVPKNADHIMAPPAVPKVPEGDAEEGNKESKTVETGAAKRGEKVAVREKVEKSDEEKKDRVKVKDAGEAGKGGTEEKKKAEEKSEKVRSSERLSSSSEREKHRSEKTADMSAKNGDNLGTSDSGSSGQKERSSSSRSSSDKDRPKDPAEAEKLKENEKLKAKEAEKDKPKEAEKDEQKAKMKAAAEAEKAKEMERAKAKAKMEEAKARAADTSATRPSSAHPVQPAPPQADPQLRRANFVAQGMLCSLIYMVNEKLALLLMAFFVYTYIQAQQQHRAPPMATATYGPSAAAARAATAGTSASSTSRSEESRGKDPQETHRKRKPSRAQEVIPAEMEAKLAAATTARRAEASAGAGASGDASAGSTSRKQRIPDAADSQLDPRSTPSQVRRETDRSPSGKKAALSQAGTKPSADGASATRPRTLGDLTPDQRERYLLVKAARMAQATMGNVARGEDAKGLVDAEKAERG